MIDENVGTGNRAASVLSTGRICGGSHGGRP